MAFFKSLVKRHGSTYFEPIGKAMVAAGIKKPNPLNPAQAWKLRKAMWPYARWSIGQRLAGYRGADLPAMPGALGEHARYAATALQRSRFEIDSLMRRHALHLPDRQCAMAELSQRVQDMVVMLVTALWAGRKEDGVVHAAADVVCSELHRRLSGRRTSGSEYRAMTDLGRRIAEGEFKAIAGIEAESILMKYTP
jgi:acyl-CoA dehydrogenase